MTLQRRPLEPGEEVPYYRTSLTLPTNTKKPRYALHNFFACVYFSCLQGGNTKSWTWRLVCCHARNIEQWQFWLIWISLTVGKLPLDIVGANLYWVVQLYFFRSIMFPCCCFWKIKHSTSRSTIELGMLFISMLFL